MNLITPEIQNEIQTQATQAEQVLALVKEVSDETMLVQLLRSVTDTAKALDERRKRITGPLTLAKAEVDALFRPATQALETIEIEVRSKLAAAEASRLGAGTTVALAAPRPDGVHYRQQWEWELEDIGQVPIEFLALNAVSLKRYIDFYKKGETIPPLPGIRFVKKVTVVQK